MRIFVGNLSWDVTDKDLTDTFSAYGSVAEASALKDRETGRARGYGFVTMNNDDEARSAIDALNGKELMGRPMTVNEARPKEDKPSNGRREFRR